MQTYIRTFSSFLIICLLGTALLSSIAHAQGAQPASVTASSEATIHVEATKALVQFQVSRNGSTAKEAAEKNARAADSVVSFLKTLSNVKQLQTTGIYLNPVSRYNDQTNQPQIIGYESRNDLSFEVPLADVGSLLDQIVQKGANAIASVTFSAEAPILEDARKRALSEATKKAKADAELLASAAGVTPKGVMHITVGSSFNPPVVYPQVRGLAMATRAEVDTPVVGGSLAVNATVTVELSL
jgi:uncharacterized protein YggE